MTSMNFKYDWQHYQTELEDDASEEAILFIFENVNPAGAGPPRHPPAAGGGA